MTTTTGGWGWGWLSGSFYSRYRCLNRSPRAPEGLGLDCHCFSTLKTTIELADETYQEIYACISNHKPRVESAHPVSSTTTAAAAGDVAAGRNIWGRGERLRGGGQRVGGPADGLQAPRRSGAHRGARPGILRAAPAVSAPPAVAAVGSEVFFSRLFGEMLHPLDGHNCHLIRVAQVRK